MYPFIYRMIALMLCLRIFKIDQDQSTQVHLSITQKKRELCTDISSLALQLQSGQGYFQTRFGSAVSRCVADIYHCRGSRQHWTKNTNQQSNLGQASYSL